MAKKILTLILFFICNQYIYSQNIDPWWIKNPYRDTASIKRLALADSILNYAYTFMGIPYVWGGNNPQTGFDCSGFICYVFKKYGVNLPRTSVEQFNAGYPVPYTEAQKGDLILFTSREYNGGNPAHVGIIINKDEKGFTFIHTSSAASGGVRISRSYDEQYYYWRFLEVRRVIN